MPHAAPQFRELTEEECKRLLAGNVVGRVAFTFHDRVDIQPINYVFDGGQWLYGRTSTGAKLDVLRHHRWVAFEVDEVHGPLDWRSVVVRGAFYPLTGDDANADPEVVAHATELLQHLDAAVLSPDDPASFRTVLFRIAVQEMSGRAASPR